LGTTFTLVDLYVLAEPHMDAWYHRKRVPFPDICLLMGGTVGPLPLAGF
jgi:hypothetical protein